MQKIVIKPLPSSKVGGLYVSSLYRRDDKSNMGGGARLQ